MMVGTTDTTFSPNVTTSRGMIVTILWSLEGKPETTDTAAFTDAVEGAWYSDAVGWASRNGLSPYAVGLRVRSNLWPCRRHTGSQRLRQPS